MSKHSKACCTIPPVIEEGYEAKGTYITLNGLKTYVTGPSSATTAILVIYDIFGFFPQTLQGADIMAYSDKEHPSMVFIPDFFEGEPADISWYPPDDDEKKAKLGKFFETKAPPQNTLPKIKQVVAEAEQHNSSIASWGTIGYCWGAKLVSLIAGRSEVFKVAVQSSPAMVDPEDAAKVKVPMMMLASKDEDLDTTKKYEANLTVKNKVETYTSQIHGWMSARADLKDAEVKKEYERGYAQVMAWFQEFL